MLRLLIIARDQELRTHLRRIVERDPELLVIGEAQTGDEALQCLQRDVPDAVLLDALLGREDGLSVCRRLMSAQPVAIVMLFQPGQSSADIAFRALQAGAIDVHPMPLSSPENSFDRRERSGRHTPPLTSISSAAEARVSSQDRAASSLRQLLHQLLRASVPKLPAVSKHSEQPTSSSPGFTRPGLQARKLELLMIGASTGGPTVLAQLLSAIPSPAPFAIVLVQHVASGFDEGLARWLKNSSKHDCQVLRSSRRLRAGDVVLAPDSQNIRFIAPMLLDLASPTESLVQSKRNAAQEQGSDMVPSIDLCFASAADHLQGAAMACLLSGMGRDGAVGMRRLRERKCLTVAQAPESCVIDSMPSAAIEMGVDAILEPNALAALLSNCARASRPS